MRVPRLSGEKKGGTAGNCSRPFGDGISYSVRRDLAASARLKHNCLKEILDHEADGSPDGV